HHSTGERRADRPAVHSERPAVDSSGEGVAVGAVCDRTFFVCVRRKERAVIDRAYRLAIPKLYKPAGKMVASLVMKYLALAAIILGMSCAASAQWVNLALPNTPRTADGKPDLAAPAPKAADGKLDLSGIWRAASGRYLQNIAADLGEPPFQPWAASLYKERAGSLGKGRPSE